MNDDEVEWPSRYVLVLDRGKGSRMSGFVAAAVYESGGEDRETVIFHMDEIDATLTGKQLGRSIGDFICEELTPGIPVSLMIGTTVDGAKPVKKVLLPAVRKRLKAVEEWAKGEGKEGIARRAGEEFSHGLYCADIAGAPRDVGRKITVHQRIGELTTALELGQMRILGDVPLFGEVSNALRSFDPSKRAAEGKDLWDAGAREGLITALTVIPKAVGYARVLVARTDAAGRVRAVDVVSPDSGFGAVSGAYVSRDGVFGVDGTVVDGGGFGARADHVLDPVQGDMSSGGRLKALGRALTSWQHGGGPVDVEGPDSSNGLRVSLERNRRHVAEGFPRMAPSAYDRAAERRGGHGGGGRETPGHGAGPGTASLNDATAAYREAGGMGESGERR